MPTTRDFVECDTCGDFALYGGVCVCDVEPEWDEDADRGDIYAGTADADDYAEDFAYEGE